MVLKKRIIIVIIVNNKRYLTVRINLHYMCCNSYVLV